MIERTEYGLYVYILSFGSMEAKCVANKPMSWKTVVGTWRVEQMRWRKLFLKGNNRHSREGWKVRLFPRFTRRALLYSPGWVLMSPGPCRIALVQELKVEKTKEPLGVPLLDLRLILGGWILNVKKCVFFKFRKFLAIKKVARRQFLQKLQKLNSEGW